ncbi:MAG: RNB domain-containing ribonuclease, partial [Lentisphaeria bacterium]|nr:RNB domain-containing ribonuclease [Lentisphaeria bacterium]
MGKKKAKKQGNAAEQTIRAKFAAANGGFGFAVPLDQKKITQDIFIPPAYTGNAIDGDIVLVRIRKERSGKRFREENRGPVGEIAEVIEHGRKNIVAQLTGKYSACPMDKHLPEEITVNTLPKGAKTGDWVKLSLLNTGKKRTKNLYAEGTERIGRAGTVAADLKAIAAEFDLQDNAYTEKQNTAAGKLEPLAIKRVRLTKPWTITIDPADAHDFDDAISLAPGKTKEEVLLGVHIADVAAYIQPGSTFDKEAAKRCFSAYIPGMFLPMLPKALTQKMSLREGVDSPAHTILFTVDKKSGKIRKTERFHSVVRIKKRLDYGTVQNFLDDPKSAPVDWTATFKKNLKLLTETVRAIRQNRREQEQFLDMPLPEIRVLCDEKTKRITGIQRKEPSEADALVEECMLAANSAVAEELIAKQT